MKYKINDGSELRIAISGRSGCGNTTVSSMLAETLSISLINFTFRQLAAERGMTLAQVIENAHNDDSYDIAVDTRQVEMAQKTSCVLGSRLAIWMLKNADLKVYLLASAETRALRIYNREGGDIEQIKSFTQMRDSEDTMRYKRLYKIDNENYDEADLVIDTADKTPEQIVQIILDELENRKLIVNY